MLCQLSYGHQATLRFYQHAPVVQNAQIISRTEPETRRSCTSTTGNKHRPVLGRELLRTIATRYNRDRSLEESAGFHQLARALRARCWTRVLFLGLSTEFRFRLGLGVVLPWI
jgi:hypothetical protein